MRKYFFLYVCVFGFLLCGFTTAPNKYIANPVQYKIVMNKEIISFEKEVVTIKDHTYIPLREVAEKLGCNVEWYEKNELIIITPKKRMIPFQMNDKWGFLNEENKVVISPIYEEVGNFNEGLAAVRKSPSMYGQYGYIDEAGVEVIPCVYTSTGDFNEGFALVSESNKWQTDGESWSYFINKNGENIFEKQYKSARSFSNGYAAVMIGGEIYPSPDITSEKQEWSFINTTGELVLSKTYDSVSDFSKGYAAVQENGIWKIIDHSFAELPNLEFESLDLALQHINTTQRDGSAVLQND